MATWNVRRGSTRGIVMSYKVLRRNGASGANTWVKWFDHCYTEYPFGWEDRTNKKLRFFEYEM
jgi:hypothetical protein